MPSRVTKADLQSLEPSLFEKFVARLLKLSGFNNVIQIGGPGDEGIDLRAEWALSLPTGDRQNTLWAVQCKRYQRTLSQREVQEVINAALEPSSDLFPTPPDYFLIATSSNLSAPATRLLERANQQRAKYSCRFVLWDGDELVERVSRTPDLEDTLRSWLNKVSSPSVTPHTSRLTVIVDHSEQEATLTFLYEGGGAIPTCTLDKTILTQKALNSLLEATQAIASRGFPDPNSELKKLGIRLAGIFPRRIRRLAFADETPHLRITSNIHIIPFELAFDTESNSFLADRRRIGRAQISSVQKIPTWPLQPKALLVATRTPKNNFMRLPEAEKELRQLHKILDDKGFQVQLLWGEEATVSNVINALTSDTFQLLHFAAHGAPELDPPGIVLEDDILAYDSLAPLPLSSTVVFMNLCSTGEFMNRVSLQLIENGAAAMAGFIGPVTDKGAATLAVAFYSTLAQGESLGEAVHRARQHQKEMRPEDWSWTSFVLFGDPTLRPLQTVS